MAQEIYFAQDIMKPKKIESNGRKRTFEDANGGDIDIISIVKAHENKIGRIDELDTVHGNISKIADEHAGALAKIHDLTTKMSAMDNKQKSTAKMTKTLTETTTAIQNSISEVSTTLADTKGDISMKQVELGNELSDVSTKLQSFEAQFQEMKNEIHRLNTELDEQKSRGFFGFLRRMFSWKRKPKAVTEVPVVEEKQTEETPKEDIIEPTNEETEGATEGSTEQDETITQDEDSDSVQKTLFTTEVTEESEVTEETEDSSDKEWLPGSN